MNFTISIILDTRREKTNGTYPIKLSVFSRILKKQKRYSLDIDLTANDFETIWINPEGKNLRGTNNEIRLKLQSIITRADEEVKQMTVFDFETFEKKFFRKVTAKNNVKYYFNLSIQSNLDNNKIGTAESYKYTLNSFAEFLEPKAKLKSKIDKLTFNEITPEWLKKYEVFMLSTGKSYTTVGIYTRTLRAVFNNAIASNDINNDIYPFGEKKNKKYQIPTSKKVKKALTSQGLKTLFDARATNENEQQAKDFWFFSYACNGMNFKDIVLLKYSDFKEDSFSYYRAKTFDKSNEKETITIYLTDFTNSIIAKYGNKNKSGYVFNIVSNKDTSQIQYYKIKNFTRLTNDHIKRIAKANDLPTDISTYWARHSFATQSIRKGASMEFISEALNHSDLNVTKNYFAGFEDEAKKTFANSLLDF
ncbi:tyrosine-type recombinase/integrase [Flavobacterium tegetincola]|uniref:tyrosine-type recombinase/integrase n=1 Tax=Flavobacterium tegetincola TaxID=150172 RepID=UPI00047C86E6|nr:site-specific integrase [Flavobacterium tegetincola]